MNWIIRKEILSNTKEFYKNRPLEKRVAGKSPIHYTGRVYDESELVSLVDASLDWGLLRLE